MRVGTSPAALSCRPPGKVRQGSIGLNVESVKETKRTASGYVGTKHNEDWPDTLKITDRNSVVLLGLIIIYLFNF